MSKLHVLSAASLLALAGAFHANAQSLALPTDAGPTAAEPALPAEPALHAAAQAGDRAKVDQLIAAGAKLEERDGYGRTALYMASRAGASDVVAALLARGAQIDAPNRAGLTPLHAAAAEGHREVAGQLVANCAPIDARDVARRTPLHMAAAGGHLEVAQLLMASGADTQARRSQGTTVLQTAAAHHQQDLADLLRNEALERARARAAEGGATVGAGASGGAAPAQDEAAELPPVSAPAAELTRIPRDPTERLLFAQRQLGALGYNPGPADGRSSAKTRDSIQAFQAHIGQIVTGSVSQCLLEQLALASRAPRK